MRQAGRMWSNGPVHNEAEVKLLNVTMFRFHIVIFTYVLWCWFKKGGTTDFDIHTRAVFYFQQVLSGLKMSNFIYKSYNIE